uniref:Uncharacterized protein n=1 Tax=Arundo donax TaxID=35708 RepID=A0A0A9DEG0_ARUDO
MRVAWACLVGLAPGGRMVPAESLRIPTRSRSSPARRFTSTILL